MPPLRVALTEAADLSDRAPDLSGDYLDLLLPDRHQLAHVGIGGNRWVLLRDCQPLAHAIGETTGEALRSLAKRY